MTAAIAAAAAALGDDRHRPLLLLLLLHHLLLDVTVGRLAQQRPRFGRARMLQAKRQKKTIWSCKLALVPE